MVATEAVAAAAGPPPGPPPTAEDLARAAVRRLTGPVRQDGCREWRGSYDRDGTGRPGTTATDGRRIGCWRAGSTATFRAAGKSTTPAATAGVSSSPTSTRSDVLSTVGSKPNADT
jgi:hypothetical protein